MLFEDDHDDDDDVNNKWTHSAKVFHDNDDDVIVLDFQKKKT